MRESAIHSGYLVLADLSGFTPFVAGSEVDHAQRILADMIGLLRMHLTPTLRLAEIEGDALFLYVPDGEICRGETIVELVESTYVAFRDRQQTMKRNATCPCQACQMMPSLDLKFVAHHGEWVMQDVSGAPKPFGSCVNLVHRLLKNDVVDRSGYRAYALFTEQALGQMGLQPDGMHTQQLEYAHLGEFTVNAIDLRARHHELTANRISYLAEEAAHVYIRRVYHAPPPVLWEYLTDPHLRNEWEEGADWRMLRQVGGRTAPGAHNHCANSDFIEEVLDWRPFDYYTVLLRYGAIRFRVTGELRPVDDGTELRWRMALESVVPRPLRRSVCRLFSRFLLKSGVRFDRLERLIDGRSREPVSADVVVA